MMITAAQGDVGARVISHCDAAMYATAPNPTAMVRARMAVNAGDA
jgi:hypothetical protein